MNGARPQRTVAVWLAGVLALAAGGCSVHVLGRPDVFLYAESLQARDEGKPCTGAGAADPLCRLEAAWATCTGDCTRPRAALVEALRRRGEACKEWLSKRRWFPEPGLSLVEAEWRTRECDGIRNRLHLVEHFSREWQYKRAAVTVPFAHGLAVSGGGLRSAAFAIGVMSGLQEIGVFDGTAVGGGPAFPRIDAISGVSGGSYAASWYFMQQYRCHQRAQTTRDPEFIRREVLNRCGPFEDHLANHSHVEPLSRLVALAVADTLVSPLNLLANGLFGWHENTTPAQWDYENELAKRFNHVPPDACPTAPNATVSSEKIALATLRDFVRPLRLPYLIVNTAAYIEDDTRHEGARLANSVYELGLERSGSQGFGYFGTPDLSVRSAVAISGAAADSSLAAGSAPKLLFSSLNHDLGVYIDNPRYDPAQVDVACTGATDPELCRKHLGLTMPWWRRVLRRVAFAPFYLADSLYRKDAAGRRIYLTDGGHAENLGVFALARRLPGRLTIIDGEWDPKFQFEGYHVLKNALRAEMGVELAVPGIDYPEEPDQRSPYTNAFPVMNGWLGTFWVRDGEGLRPVTIPVKYIKLSIDSRNLEQYWGTWFKSYYEAQGFGHPYGPPADLKYPCRPLGGCPFPQQSTFDMEFDEPQFRAYRDLGRWIVVRHYTKGDARTTGAVMPIGTP